MSRSRSLEKVPQSIRPQKKAAMAQIVAPNGSPTEIIISNGVLCALSQMP